jgi:hypothetical protein
MSLQLSNHDSWLSTTHDFNFGNNFTWMMWIKFPSDFAAGAYRFLHASGNTVTRTLLTGNDATKITEDCGGGTYGSGASSLSSGVWYHFAVRRTGASALTVIRDATVTELTDTYTTTSDVNTSLFIGGYTTGLSSAATITQCRLWATDLSDAEILAEKNSATPVKSGIAHNWPLANGTDTSEPVGSWTLTLSGTATTGADDPSQGGTDGTVTLPGALLATGAMPIPDVLIPGRITAFRIFS